MTAADQVKTNANTNVKQDSGWFAESAVAWARRPHLSFELDVDVCVIGGGCAGLTTALELARRGASVALLEGREIGWNASGVNLGTVTPGYSLDIEDIVGRIGVPAARELWNLSRQGVAHVREAARQMESVAPTDGFLEVSNTDNGDRLLRRLQLLSADFGMDVEGWQAERVREVVRTPHYFHGIRYPESFHVHALNYARGLALQAERAGVRIFEDTTVTGIDPAGVRKRVMTGAARLRSSFIVLAGNVHLGPSFPRLSQTLLPAWRYIAVTEPLGERLDEALRYAGAVRDNTGLDHFRRIGPDRLIWSGPVTTWSVHPRLMAAQIRRRIRRVFPQLGEVAIADIRSGVTGETVHGMPQIGQLRRGLWIASGFGGHGIGAAATAGQLVAQGITGNDDRWRLFAPFELVWSGGVAGRVVAQAVYGWSRTTAGVAGTIARLRERARQREQIRQRKAAAATQAVKAMHAPQAGPRPRPPPVRRSSAQPTVREPTSREREQDQV